MMRYLLVCFTCMLPSSHLFAQQTPPPLAADLVVVNAKVWTVNRTQPEAEALAVMKDRIVFVGTSNVIYMMPELMNGW